jgi:DNA-binding LytR/AlgR family response regulator
MLTALIAEDEKLARERLKRLLKAFPEIQVIGEAEDGRSALEFVNRQKPDILFLDIQMPEMTGVEIVSHFTHIPYIIFTTAYDEYALKAFEIGAVDYLLKPITKETVQRALDRVLRQGKDKPGDTELVNRIVGALKKLEEKKHHPSILTVRQGNRFRVLDVKNITVLRAEDRYVICYTDNDEYVMDGTIKQLAETLDPQQFIQVHRGIVVNVSAIQDIQRSLFTKSGYELKIAGVKDLLPVGKTYLKSLRERLGF